MILPLAGRGVNAAHAGARRPTRGRGAGLHYSHTMSSGAAGSTLQLQALSRDEIKNIAVVRIVVGGQTVYPATT